MRVTLDVLCRTRSTCRLCRADDAAGQSHRMILAQHLVVPDNWRAEIAAGRVPKCLYGQPLDEQCRGFGDWLARRLGRIHALMLRLFRRSVLFPRGECGCVARQEALNRLLPGRRGSHHA